ncbi:hypothetical protein FRB94_011521 [Tulasnella sp. JGI-2019a]|nr:hypothetical protein FRB93_009796 [Tulasnella sp. JGI-2019a]KAG8992527.1 hypothetical protein FRB94_011521 [Tulasnella sp. JGI-2019a]
MSGPSSGPTASTATEEHPVAGPSTSPPPQYVPPKPIAPKGPLRPILKRPPPPPQPFFSSFRSVLNIGSKFLPPAAPTPQATTAANGNGNGSLNGTPQANGHAAEDQSLRRAHFIVPHLTTTYLISSAAPPSTPGLSEAIRDIEDREAERRLKDSGIEGTNWSLERIEEFYRECCRLRDETVLVPVVRSIQLAGIIPPRVLDLTGIKLSPFSATALADTLSMEWGLRKLVLKDCDLEELALKPILHALLIPQSLPYLSLSGNKRLKPAAFKLIGIYATKANALQFLDLSQTPLDKRSVEYIVAALEPAPAPVSSSSSQHRTNGVSSPTSPQRSTSLLLSPLSPTTPLISEGTANNNSSNSYFSSNHTSSADGLPPSGFSTPSVLSNFARSLTNGSSSPTRRPSIITDSRAHSPAPSLQSQQPPSPPLSPMTTYRSPSARASQKKRRRVQLVSLRLDECGLRAGSLEVLAQAIRPSCVRHLSLRSNRIGPTGAVALALMIKDYPDSMPIVGGIGPGATNSPRLDSMMSGLLSNAGSPGSPAKLPLPGGGGLATSSPGPSPAVPATAAAVPQGGALPQKPPPRHPLLQQYNAPPSHSASPGGAGAAASPAIVPTYTPYIPRSRRNIVPATPSAVQQSQSSSVPPSPTVITSNKVGGVTARQNHVPPLSSQQAKDKVATVMGGAGKVGTATLEGHSAALLDRVRSLDNLPRLGALQTLDLRSNDLRGGVTYIAQVLKRNRTLKVLNLSENRVDVQGLVVIAEALKYNSTLETLDMSRNPCCGPGLEGVTSVRTAYTINTSLKRLFLSGTSLTSAGAIALAEFLPDARSLLHLDLTHNTLDLAGVMALSVGLKMNEVMRCVDVNVPPNDTEFARLSREIFKCCVRNTERAESELGGAGRWAMDGSTAGDGTSVHGSGEGGEGLGLLGLGGLPQRGGVWGLIEKSELAKGIKEVVEKERLGEEKRELTTLSGKERLDVWTKTPPEMIRASKECIEDLQLLLGGVLAPENGQKERLVERAQAFAGVIAEMVQVEKDPEILSELLPLNDELLSYIKRVRSVTEQGLSISLPPANGFMTEGTVMSPKVDYKGKGRATPQDEEAPYDMFGKARVRQRGDDEPVEGQPQESGGTDARLDMPSPVERSRLWVVEEAEVFRKGQVLLGPEEMGELEEGEGAQATGDELRIELLEAEVERPRQRLIDSEYDNPEGQLDPQQQQQQSVRRVDDAYARSPASPTIAR